jgi:hypothetical protein
VRRPSCWRAGSPERSRVSGLRGENGSDTTGERTEQERERAREERERQRLAKAVAAPSAPPEPAPAPPLPPPLQALPSVPPPTQPRPSYGSTQHPPRRRIPRLPLLIAVLLALAVLAAAAVLLLKPSPHPPPAPPPPKVVKIVIPEGFTRAQIAVRAGAAGLRGSYLAASVRSGELNPAHYLAPAGTPNLEGFLFPATYEIYAGESVSRLLSEQLTAFKENFGGGEVHRAKVLGVTPYQLLIVASIIEREAATAHDRPLVAAVIYNRLRLHMTLGIDSTLRYALNDFTKPLTEAQLHSNSPYNTRIHVGLPPTPISNPGAAAIKAAARPAKVSYLYYVAGADGCGELVFSTGYAEFERNAAAYREALSRNGRVPTCKKR